MPLKIVRNDITKMNTEAIVNTASEVEPGSAFITPGFNLEAKYIIHAASPLYKSGNDDDEEKLRECYKNVFDIALANNIKSISFPLIWAGSFGYPKEEGMRIAVDEINAFLLTHSMDVYLVVFDSDSTNLGKNIYPELKSYIDRHYVSEKTREEYSMHSLLMDEDSVTVFSQADASVYAMPSLAPSSKKGAKESPKRRGLFADKREALFNRSSKKSAKAEYVEAKEPILNSVECSESFEATDSLDILQDKLAERMKHLSDTFSEYLLFLISNKGMENADVYKRAIVDRKIFSKIKNNPDYHPQKITALCLCIGAKLNLDETKDLLARAGYALSPCDKTDIIFQYFIENEIYDMIELDIMLEEHGLPCIIE